MESEKSGCLLSSRFVVLVRSSKRDTVGRETGRCARGREGQPQADRMGREEKSVMPSHAVMSAGTAC